MLKFDCLTRGLTFVLLVFSYAGTNILLAQTNLVQNGGFEAHSTCPNFGAQWNFCNGWNNVNMNTGLGYWGTPDYFHTCGTGGVIPPNTFAGVCNTHSGSAMMALVLYNIPYPNYREFLSTQLSCSMFPGTTYTVSFWITNGTGVISPWTISNIGIHFSNAPLTQNGFGLINVIPQCEVTSNITSTVWTQYTFTINPTSPWNYLTIGAFRNDASNNVVLSFPNPGGPPSSYANYFFDDIQVLSPANGSNTVNITNSSGSFSICPGQTITLVGTGANSYTWNSGSNSPSISVSPTVTTSYSVSGFNACTGSFAQASATVFVKDTPLLNVNGTSNVCSGEAVTLNASGANTYQWSNGMQGATITFTPLTTTMYTVVGTSANTCTNSAIYQVNVSPSPTLNLAGPSTICAGTQANYTATGANTYTWSLGFNSSSISFTPQASAYYTLNASAANGCTAELIFLLNVVPNPTVSLTGPNIVCFGTQVNCTASGASTYSWSMGLNGPSISFTPQGSSNYTVYGTSNIGCSATATLFLAVVECLGIDENKAGDAFRLSPNPVDDHLMVLSGKGVTGSIETIQLLDEKGNTIKVFMPAEMNYEPEGLRLNFSNLIKGVYLLSIRTKEQVFTKKIIKN